MEHFVKHPEFGYHTIDGITPVNIVGNEYHGNTFARLKTERVHVGQLVSEPGNKHDPNAVAVIRGNRKLGYLSRGRAAQIQPWVNLQGGTYPVYLLATPGNGYVGVPTIWCKTPAPAPEPTRRGLFRRR